VQKRTVANVFDFAFGCAFVLYADDAAVLHWAGRHCKWNVGYELLEFGKYRLDSNSELKLVRKCWM
jgi:hypothetical protein